jgi:DNA (cytosine-5)-methyltransferase 1
MGLGLHMAGWTGTGMELDADAVATHLANVGPCLLADITTASAPHGADLVAGGVPCQTFSVAGKQAGFDDPRGQLFASLLRIGVEAGARCILLENVRGLVSCGALPVILQAFRAAGYEPVHALLCAADYGVPQNRVRLFIAGFRCADDLARFQWPAPSHGSPGNLYGLPRWRTVRDALALPAGDYAHGPLPHARKSGSQGMMVVNVDAPSRTVAGRNNADLLDRPAHTVSAGGTASGGAEPFANAGYRKRLAAAMATALDRPSPTVTASEYKSAPHFGSRGAVTGARRAGDRLLPALGVTRMTVAQLAALQSFPAGFAFTGNLSSQHRQCGNAVPPLLARALGLAIHRALYGAVALAGAE